MRAAPFLLTGVLVSGALGTSPAAAQPAPAADVVRAKELYLAGELAMKEQRYADAVRDYGATFDLTRDPVLFFKIASANERAGNCNVALIYYGRYVKEARPSPTHVELTRERIVACGGDPRNATMGGSAAASASGAPGASEGTAAAVTTDTAPTAEDPGTATTATTDTTGPGSTAAGPTIMPAPAPAPPLSLVTMPARNRGAWLLVSGSIAFVTIGSVLAYSANSAEADVDDLYQGFGGQPVQFDERTQETYQALLDEGRRYEKLSWVSFGLAGITAVGAAVLFATAPDAKEKAVTVTPAVGPSGGSVSATLRW
ncbi:MAG: repeat-containing protein [Myxococcales bacterium]|nr:repeat-containing protein [Myxococcales bacterium]